MNEDWYDFGRASILTDIEDLIRRHNEFPDDAAKAIYALLSEYGFIDYDVEKEIFYEWWEEFKSD